jgi:hypothetical protein
MKKGGTFFVERGVIMFDKFCSDDDFFLTFDNQNANVRKKISQAANLAYLRTNTRLSWKKSVCRIALLTLILHSPEFLSNSFFVVSSYGNFFFGDTTS